MKTLGYRLCSECGRIDVLGEKEYLETEADRVFTEMELVSLETRWTGNLSYSIHVSLEDPSWCTDCERKIHEQDVAKYEGLS